MRAAATSLEHQEFDGFVVAVALGVGVVIYGSLVGGLWRDSSSAHAPAARVHDVSTAVVSPVIAAGPPAAVPVPSAEPDVVLAPATPKVPPRRAAPAVAQHIASVTPNPRMLAAIWQRRDTRSLGRAFATLRGQTLAFHRCGLRVTADDRAVARCDGVATATAADGTRTPRPATWTIDFRRTAGRWVMAGVTMR